MLTQINAYIQNYSTRINSVFSVTRDFYNNYFDMILRCIATDVAPYLLFLRYDWTHQLQLCIDVISIDQPGKDYRFTVVYCLLSITYNMRYQLITQTSALKGLETICIIYLSANWSEREIWDIFGIFIFFHPDLRRILTDYGFKGFPLRKDFPLTGYKEIVYSDFSARTVYRNVQLIQDYRNHDYTNPWIDELIKELVRLGLIPEI